MNPDQAETLALRALGWLASQDELFPVFLGASGASPQDMALRAADPEFLIAVLDFITMDDSWVVEFCDTVGVSYDAPLRARQALPGGAEMNWT